jgi:hypothetical protein
MSLAGVLAAIIGGVISLLLSAIGIMAVLAGLVLFLALPIIPRATGIGHWLTGLHLSLGTGMLKRMAVVVTDQGDLLLKRMRPTENGTEAITIDGEQKEFEYLNGTGETTWLWRGVPFALAESVHGVLFDPRHALLGEQKTTAAKQNELVAKATEAETSRYDNLIGWCRGVFEIPRGYSLPDLGTVKHLMTGSERSEHPTIVDDYYSKSREPYDEGGSASRYILLILAAVGPFVALAVTADQFGGGGGGTVVGPGALLWLLITGLSAGDGGPDWRELGKTAGLVVPPLVLIGLLWLTQGWLFTTVLLILVTVGFLLIPFLSVLFRPSTGASQRLSRLLLKLGLLAYERPVWELTPTGYQLREFANLPETADVTWHGFLGGVAGFTFTPNEAALWGSEWVEAGDIKTRLAETDGGKAVTSNIPKGHQPLPDKRRADVYGMFVPDPLRRTVDYVWSGIALERFKHVATGEKSHNRLRQAKKEHGGVNQFSHKSFTIALTLLSLSSTAAGVVVFFL